MFDITLELSIVKSIEGIPTNDKNKALECALEEFYEFNGFTLDEAIANGIITPKIISIKKYEESDAF